MEKLTRISHFCNEKQHFWYKLGSENLYPIRNQRDKKGF